MHKQLILPILPVRVGTTHFIKHILVTSMCTEAINVPWGHWGKKKIMPTIFSTDGVVPLQKQLLTWNCGSYCVVMGTLLIIVIAFFHSDHQTMSKLIPIPAAPNPVVVSSAFRLQTKLDTIPLNKDRNMRSTLSSTDHGHSHSAIKKFLLKRSLLKPPPFYNDL